MPRSLPAGLISSPARSDKELILPLLLSTPPAPLPPSLSFTLSNGSVLASDAAGDGSPAPRRLRRRRRRAAEPFPAPAPHSAPGGVLAATAAAAAPTVSWWAAAAAATRLRFPPLTARCRAAPFSPAALPPGAARGCRSGRRCGRGAADRPGGGGGGGRPASPRSDRGGRDVHQGQEVQGASEGDLPRAGGRGGGGRGRRLGAAAPPAGLEGRQRGARAALGALPAGTARLLPAALLPRAGHVSTRPARGPRVGRAVPGGGQDGALPRPPHDVPGTPRRRPEWHDSSVRGDLGMQTSVGSSSPWFCFVWGLRDR